MDRLMGEGGEDAAARSPLAQMVQHKKKQRKVTHRRLAGAAGAGACSEARTELMPRKSEEETRHLLLAEKKRQRKDHQAAFGSIYVCTELEAAQLRLALGSLLHPRLASHAAIANVHAPLADLLFSVATQPQLQFRPITLTLLTFQRKVLFDVEERVLPAQMTLFELLHELCDPPRLELVSRIGQPGPPIWNKRRLGEVIDKVSVLGKSGLSFKAYHGPLHATRGATLEDLDQDRIVTLDERSVEGLPTVEQFVDVDKFCLMKMIT
jgi:hypothetical protein